MSYEVGDQDVDDLNNSWTAVYVSGGWRFVFPLWAFSGVVGHSTGTWTLVENQGIYNYHKVKLAMVMQKQITGFIRIICALHKKPIKSYS